MHNVRFVASARMGIALLASLISIRLGVVRNHHRIISQAQYPALVTVVIVSAVVPTLIAERFFVPVSGFEHPLKNRQTSGGGR